MLEQIKKIIIIVGCQRSGTTLLGQMMGAPEHCLLLDETDVIELDAAGGFVRWYGRFVDNDPEAVRMLSAVLAEAGNKYRDPGCRVRVNTDGYAQLAPGISHLVLKAPNLTYSFDEIAALKIPVGVVYAIRDPRAVVASMLNLSHIKFVDNQLKLLERFPALQHDFQGEIAIMADQRQPLPVRCALLWWVKSSLYQRFTALGIASYLCRYETLTADIGAACKVIAEQIHIPFDELMLKHQSVYQGIAQGKTDRTRAVDRQSLNKWTAGLSNEQQEQILAVISNAAETLGYTLGST